MSRTISTASPAGSIDVDSVERAAGRHGVAGIDREVHHDLLELPAVDLDGADVGGERGLETHVGADEPLQHVGQPGDGGVEIDGRRRDGASAGEGQQLCRRLRGAVGSATHLFEAVAHLAGSCSYRAASLYPADHGQQVVEVVGDAAGQAADRLHLLRLAQFLGETVALGDVAQFTMTPAISGSARRLTPLASRVR
ncbi:MAG: hypothetical protein U0P30_16745 [Vicinamibacterales bacterium]